jgi:hypothetical protein
MVPARLESFGNGSSPTFLPQGVGMTLAPSGGEASVVVPAVGAAVCAFRYCCI